MARRLKGKALPETKQQRADRLAAQEEAKKYLPVVYGIIVAMIAAVVLYIRALSR